MNDHAIIYVWWNDAHTEPWRDLRNPIMPSIATLRAVDHQVPIYVLDCSDEPHQWGRFPHRLDFQVIRSACNLPRLVPEPTRKLCGRVFLVDAFIKTIPESKIMVCDSDILWLRSPLPMVPPITHFHGNCHNNGFFGFDKDSGQALHFLDTWKLHTLRALEDPAHREEVVRNYFVPFFNDEAVYCYVRHLCPDLIRELGVYWNFVDHREVDWASVAINSRNYHFCHKTWGTERGIYALAIQEFYHRLEMVLSPEEIVMIFGEGRMFMARRYGFEQMKKARIIHTVKPKVF